jgi:hypothetical protein
MSILMYLVVMTGLTASIVVLALAAAKRRAAPPRTALWILGLVVLGIDTLLHVVASVGMAIAGGVGGAWLYLGTLGFVALLAAAFIRPRWAGVALLASAVLVPLMLAVGGLVGGEGERADVPWSVAAVTYSVPAVLSGSLLLGSTIARRRGVEDVSLPAHGVRTVA